MTLLVCLFAAIASSFAWYRTAPANELRADVACFVFWGASLMWLVDAVFEYLAEGAAFFETDPVALLNDLVLGLAVVAVGLVIWLVALFVTDPRGAVRAALTRRP